MRLLSFRKEHGVRLGVCLAPGVLDVPAAAVRLALDVPVTMEELIQAGEPGRAALEALVERALAQAADLTWEHEETLAFAPCLTRPEKILCVGTNYRKHALEAHLPVPSTPVLFSKFNNALSGHNATVQLPTDGEHVDYEVELVVVIGKEAKDVPREQALQYVFGYCTGNDLSVRDLQFRTGQWLLGKSLDGFAPLGPYLVTADEVSNPNALQLELRVNGELRQSSNTADMIFDCAELIHYASSYMTLKPGDLIFTGTPEGVILGYPPEQRVWLRSGDEVVATVAGLGSLRTVLA
ncbi:MAG: fumarylacetoacetate hydrolase family protein [Alicyclobacillus sp.]|nr:fumarylacetoacetate hydrolase family protein [Alicyclobacillus sp.]